MSPNDRSRTRRRRWPWILVAVVLVAAVGVFFLNARRTAQLMRNTYTVVKPTVGKITATVYGSGSLDAGRTFTVYAPATGRVEQALASAGDAVKKYDVIAVLSSDALDARISQDEAQIAAIDAKIAALPTTAGSKDLRAPVAGRIMALYGAAGDPVASVMAGHDALLVLSGDGKCTVAIDAVGAVALLKPGTAVKVSKPAGVEGAKDVDGVVLTQTAASTVVQFPDAEFAGWVGARWDAGMTVVVKSTDGASLGEGDLRISAPVFVTASSGILHSVRYAVGDKVSKGATLFTLEEAGASSAFLDLVDQRTKALADLDDARGAKLSLTLTAPADGVLQSLALVEKGQAVEGQPAFVVAEDSTYTMQVMVDELDVPGVQVGQTASLQLSAFPYKAFPATVERISDVGRSVSGVTQYPVLLRIPAVDGMKLGMSASADIVVAEKASALTIPIAALKVDGTRTYVTVVRGNGTRQATTEDVDVTVGLVTGSLVEILSGVTASDEIQLVDDVNSGMGGFFRPDRPTA